MEESSSSVSVKLRNCMKKGPRHEKVWPVEEMVHWSKIYLFVALWKFAGQRVRRLGLKYCYRPNEFGFGDLQCVSICVFVFIGFSLWFIFQHGWLVSKESVYCYLWYLSGVSLIHLHTKNSWVNQLGNQ